MGVRGTSRQQGSGWVEQPASIEALYALKAVVKLAEEHSGPEIGIQPSGSSSRAVVDAFLTRVLFADEFFVDLAVTPGGAFLLNAGLEVLADRVKPQPKADLEQPRKIKKWFDPDEVRTALQHVNGVLKKHWKRLAGSICGLAVLYTYNAWLQSLGGTNYELHALWQVPEITSKAKMNKKGRVGVTANTSSSSASKVPVSIVPQLVFDIATSRNSSCDSAIATLFGYPLTGFLSAKHMAELSGPLSKFPPSQYLASRLKKSSDGFLQMLLAAPELHELATKRTKVDLLRQSTAPEQEAAGSVLEAMLQRVDTDLHSAEADFHFPDPDAFQNVQLLLPSGAFADGLSQEQWKSAVRPEKLHCVCVCALQQTKHLAQVHKVSGNRGTWERPSLDPQVWSERERANFKMHRLSPVGCSVVPMTDLFAQRWVYTYTQLLPKAGVAAELVDFLREGGTELRLPADPAIGGEEVAQIINSNSPPGTPATVPWEPLSS
eukprot:g15626.t1